jgi:hypothetical protein
LGGRGFGLYEPISGTAPNIAGRGIANPRGGDQPAAARRPERSHPSHERLSEANVRFAW